MRAGAAIVAGLLAVAGLVAAVPASSAAPTAVSTGVDDFTFESFNAQYYLDLDDRGYVTTRVVETIVALFDTPNQNRGIIRAIPDEAFGFDLDVQLTSITNAAGSPVYVERYETSYYDDQGELVDWIEFYVDDDTYKQGRTTYVIEYTMKNTIVNTANGRQEFYWDVNGDGWPQPFGSVTADVHLSPALQAAVIPNAESCYEGSFGDRSGSDTCRITATSDGFSSSTEDVFPRSTLTVAIPFQPGTVTQTVRPSDSWVVQLAPKLIAGLIGVLVILGFVVRNALWRSPRPGLVIAQYDPPPGRAPPALGRDHRPAVPRASRPVHRLRGAWSHQDHRHHARSAADRGQAPVRARVRVHLRGLAQGTARAHPPVRREPGGRQAGEPGQAPGEDRCRALRPQGRDDRPGHQGGLPSPAR